MSCARFSSIGPATPDCGASGVQQGMPVKLRWNILETRTKYAAAGLVGFDMALRGLKPVSGVAREDHAEHPHKVVVGGQLGVGAQRVGGLTEVRLPLLDVIESAHIV
jgi:hypothetical protein